MRHVRVNSRARQTGISENAFLLLIALIVISLILLGPA